MKRNTRLVTGFVIVCLFMFITACGAVNTESSKNNKSDGDSNKVNEVVSGEQSNEQRIVKTLKGDISIPVNPQKVIGLSVVYPEFLYALGVTPIAVQNYHPEFPAYLQDPFKDTVKMGIAQTPNFEAILAAEPDLIIAPTWWSDKDYDQLTKIAPTVLLPQRDDWRDELRDIAEVLDKKEQAEGVIQDLHSKEVAAKEKLHSIVGDETVMYLMVLDKEKISTGVILFINS
jgi:iron complex transport system substrate-binding protein